MKTKIACTFLLGASIWAPVGLSQVNCTDATLQGDYGFAVSGMKPSSPTGPIEMMIGVAFTTFDGNGGLVQTDNIHGSISGYPTPDRPGTGTYTVNSDCTGTMTVSNQGAPTLTLRIVVVDNGNEVRTVVVSPLTVMVTSNGRRTVSNNRGLGAFPFLRGGAKPDQGN